jgi:hypothetical protein
LKVDKPSFQDSVFVAVRDTLREPSLGVACNSDGLVRPPLRFSRGSVQLAHTRVEVLDSLLGDVDLLASHRGVFVGLP